MVGSASNNNKRPLTPKSMPPAGDENPLIVVCYILLINIFCDRVYILLIIIVCCKFADQS